MVSAVIKNWDKNNWLSSKDYILNLNKFIIKLSKLDSNSKILDIGCGRGKIIGSLSSRLKLKKKPFGIDLVYHKDKDKRIKFKKIDALNFFSNNKKKFDLILLKQTIHLLKFKEIKDLLLNMKRSLNNQGKILILMLDPHKNEIPNFDLMKKKLAISLNRDKKILNLISKTYPKIIIKNFSYKVKIDKIKYINMVKERFISTLLSLDNKQIINGINEINFKYEEKLEFNDKLICIIIKNI